MGMELSHRTGVEGALAGESGSLLAPASCHSSRPLVSPCTAVCLQPMTMMISAKQRGYHLGAG